MRMFLIGMCDIFLILYLTAITNVHQPKTILTVEDFQMLKTMHESLKEDKTKAEQALRDQLRKLKEEQEILAAEKARQAKLAEQRFKDLSSQKENLASKLDEEQKRLDQLKQNLSASDAAREEIAQDLQRKENLLKAREQILARLNEEIEQKEQDRKELEASYQKELQKQISMLESNQTLAQRLEQEALQAKQLAQEIQQKALEDKKVSKEKVEEMMAAWQQAEAEKDKALKAVEETQAKMIVAKKNVAQLKLTVQQIKQDSDAAYTENIRPQLQKIYVKYYRQVGSQMMDYDRELELLPVKINDKVFAVFPSQQIGFLTRSDRAPEGLSLMYQGQMIKDGLMHKEYDLIAIPLKGYTGEALIPHPVDKELVNLMPALLALRNNGNVSLSDKIRGISDEFFVVNREHLEVDQNNILNYAVRGFRGTGARGERIVRGDQLVDLNGRLIGVASEANQIIRVNNLEGWEKVKF